MLRGLFWKQGSPFVWPRLVAGSWIIGAARLLVWSYRAKKLLVGVLIVFAPLGVILAVIGSSGAWTFHNYRYISAAFPLIMATAACAVAPIRLPERVPGSAWFQRAWLAGCVLLLGLFVRAAYKPMRADMEDRKSV